MAVETIQQAARDRTICLVGNPNTGKSVIFGILTGTYVTVSNYPGTTVEILKGSASIHGQSCIIVDTPGTNSLIPMSEDERVTRDILIDQPPNLVLQVGDAKNLKRVLNITVQLAEMGLPVALALNMADEAHVRGIHIDTEMLSEALGIPVVSTIAVERKGVDDLMGALKTVDAPRHLITYPDHIEHAVEAISALLPPSVPSQRGLALMFLSGDDSLEEWLSQHASGEVVEGMRQARASAEQRSRLPLSQIINQHRVQFIYRLAAQVTKRTEGSEGPVAGFLGRMSMNPIWGVPVLLLVLWCMWEFVGVFGAGTVVNFVEKTIFGRFINPAAIKLFAFVPIPFIRELFVGQYGIITMAITYGIAIVLPIVFGFFLAFGVLEDSGYLPRLAVMVNQIFRSMGLNGKAVLPMVLGLGCDTMATLTTRILETPRERTIVTLLLAVGVPCSAQLGVVLALLTTPKALLIWCAVILMVLLIVGYLAGQLMPGQSSDFILEVPPLRIPKFSNILTKTVARSEWYLKEALPLFVVGTLVLFGLDKFRILGVIQRICSPVVTGFLGLPPQATKAFIMGFLRRDYGGAGLKAMYDAHQLTNNQLLVSLVTITLFVPCIAQFFVMIKERGWKSATAMFLFVMPFAVLVGGLVRLILRVGF